MIGADVIKICRIKEAAKSEHFLKRVFTDGERLYAAQKNDFAETLAGIYAAKEAVAKISKKGLRGFWLSDIEICHEESGAPYVVFHNKAAEIFGDKLNAEVDISISHDGDYAFAVASLVHETKVPVLPGREITDSDLEVLKRDRFTNKGDYGRVYVVGGSPDMVGAPLICAEAAARAGAGLTTLVSADTILYSYRQRVNEIMLLGLNDEDGFMTPCDNFDLVINKADAIAIGMGMGHNSKLEEMLKRIFDEFKGFLICDADALNALARSPELLLMPRKCKLILTPHVKEFERLNKSFCLSAQNFAAKTNSIVVYKSAYTLVTDGITSYNITSGCAAMAKGGSGDALAGIIAAYALRTEPVFACALACFAFGRAGEKAQKIKGENAVLASDIIQCL